MEHPVVVCYWHLSSFHRSIMQGVVLVKRELGVTLLVFFLEKHDPNLFGRLLTATTSTTITSSSRIIQYSFHNNVGLCEKPLKLMLSFFLILGKSSDHFSFECSGRNGRWPYFTMWKFHKFSITLILREINFRDPRSGKTAILTYCDFYQILHFLEADIYRINYLNSQLLKWQKWQFCTLNPKNWFHVK